MKCSKCKQLSEFILMRSFCCFYNAKISWILNGAYISITVQMSKLFIVWPKFLFTSLFALYFNIHVIILTEIYSVSDHILSGLNPSVYLFVRLFSYIIDFFSRSTVQWGLDDFEIILMFALNKDMQFYCIYKYSND